MTWLVGCRGCSPANYRRSPSWSNRIPLSIGPRHPRHSRYFRVDRPEGRATWQRRTYDPTDRHRSHHRHRRRHGVYRRCLCAAARCRSSGGGIGRAGARRRVRDGVLWRKPTSSACSVRTGTRRCRRVGVGAFHGTDGPPHPGVIEDMDLILADNMSRAARKISVRTSPRRTRPQRQPHLPAPLQPAGSRRRPRGTRCAGHLSSCRPRHRSRRFIIRHPRAAGPSTSSLRSQNGLVRRASQSRSTTFSTSFWA